MINFAGIYNNRYNMKYGFVRVAAAIPIVKVADCKFNAQQIETQIARRERSTNYHFPRTKYYRVYLRRLVRSVFTVGRSRNGFNADYE